MSFFTLVMIGCPSNTPRDTFDYRKSPASFSVRPLEGDTSSPTKFVLFWKNPPEQENFLGLHLVLDTSDWDNTVKTLQQQLNVADFKNPVHTIPWQNQIVVDSLLFSFQKGLASGVQVQSPYNGVPYILVDSTGHLDSKDSLHFTFGLVPVYSENSNGQPRFTQIVIGDRFSPNIISNTEQVFDRSVHFSWVRPTDPTSFFATGSEADTGVIQTYHIALQDQDFEKNTNRQPLQIDSIIYKLEDQIDTIRQGSQLETFVQLTSSPTSGNIAEITLPDGRSFQRLPSFQQENQISVTLYGLFSQQPYSYRIYAKDTAGNSSRSKSEERIFVTTDTTQPLTPSLAANNDTPNTIQISWAAVRDTRPQDSIPNSHIERYHVQRVEYLDSTYNTAIDSVSFSFLANTSDSIQFTQESSIQFLKNSASQNSDFIVTSFFLPPKTSYRFIVWAEDSTKYLSQQDSIHITTLAVQPVLGSNPTLLCPAGFTFIPRPDSLSFCIEQQEHQQTSGIFQTHVTHQEAVEACNALSTATDSVYLCTEANWQRACEGGNQGNLHQYGIQSLDSNNPASASLNVLQSVCNQATNDQEMAENINLRNRKCATREGVFDMTGNYSEWVQTGDDSLGSVRFRGGNYLLPSTTLQEAQSKALCTYSGTPHVQRPSYETHCISDNPNLSIHFSDSIACPNFNTPVLSFSFLTEKINDKAVPKSGIEVLLQSGDSTWYFREVSDTISKPANYATLHNTPSLLEVRVQLKSDTTHFVIDTLDYTPLAFSQEEISYNTPSSHPQLRKEVNTQWDIIPLKPLYGYVLQSGNQDVFISKVAKTYYQHSVIGFRCCSQPK
jgi:hypothetical protein